MNEPFRSCELKTVLYGHTGRGTPLREYQWGNKEKSILFLSGFTPRDHPLSEALISWLGMLEEGIRREGILGDFNLKHLQNRCRVRLIPRLDPDCGKINQNGLNKITRTFENAEKNENIEFNSRGVNLNRNFNANWIKMKQKNPMRTDCGLFPESEAEVSAFVRKIKEDRPAAAVILRYGQKALFFPKEATQKEQKEAAFLGQYGGFPLYRAKDTDGTALQWMTDRGIKVLEVSISPREETVGTKLRDFLTMCAALT